MVEVHPQTVGREFVRQYYTLLHEAPNYLYRFYSNNSSFIHGGRNDDDSIAIGQTKIHQRINELNFRDCRAKILHVDSQSSVSDGVVIQVTGELSNNGEPMRRFIQTFVLVPLSSKNYYVHNDIFRYADEVYGDAVSNGSAGLHNTGDTANGVDQAVQVQAESVPVSFASQPVVMPVPVPVPVPLTAVDPLLAAPLAAAAVPVPVPVPVSVPVAVPVQVTVLPSAPAQVLPLLAQTEPAVLQQPSPATTPAPPVAAAEVQPAATTTTSVPNEVEKPPAVTSQADAATQQQTAAPSQPAATHPNKHTSAGRRGVQQPQPAAPAAQPVEPPKPKTWAALVNAKPATDPSADAGKVRPATTPKATPSPASAPAPTPSPAPAPAPAPAPTSAPAPSPAPAPALALDQPSDAADSGAEKQPAESTWEMDSRQVFVGGIPPTVTESVLQEQVAATHGVKVVGWRWLREAEHGFACGLLLLDSDEAAAKLINASRPHVLNRGVHVNFEAKRDFRLRPTGGRRYPPRYGPPPPNAAAGGERGPPRVGRGYKRV